MAASGTLAWVKPAPDRVYRIPATKQLLEADGREVDTTDLDWARALRDRDVVIFEPEVAEAPAPAEPEAPPAPAPEALAPEAPPEPDPAPAPAKGASKASSPAPAAEGEG
jgi:hypothetical protein